MENSSSAFLLGGKTVYKTQTTIGHWKLRNLLSVPENTKIATADENNIAVYNTETGHKHGLFDSLPFQPVSFSVSGPYAAVSGPQGELVVRNVALETQREIPGEKQTRNFVCIEKFDGCFFLLTASNKRKVAVYALPLCRLVEKISLPFQVNNIAVHPENKTLLCVGDSPFAILLNLFSRDGEKENSRIYSEAASCFSPAWNKTGSMLGFSCEDCFVSLWDVRALSPRPLAKIQSAQKDRKGICRSMAFSTDSYGDILAYAEHANCFNVVSTRDFLVKETFLLSDQPSDIAGLSFSPDSASLFVSSEKEVAEYSVNTFRRRKSESKTFF
ncbi:MAG: WD40 repeat-like protein [Amphiamblys sp. WSBS2006]|nr:MAG: WD40 repeat-like protein [Amphiamblys sp. WSBS2006]